MYGTIGRLRVKSGAEEGVVARLSDCCEQRVPGARALYLYRADTDPERFYVVLVFESKDAYLAYGNRFRTVLNDVAELRGSSGEWEDGDIVYENDIACGGL